MKILAVIKGFVTNSSSGNYWLDDGVLEEDELSSTVTNTSTIQAAVQPSDQSTGTQQTAVALLQDNLLGLLLWIAFSLLALAVFIMKKTLRK